MTISTVCMIGLGHIGLPTAAVAASKGLHVIGVDVRKEVVDTVNAGGIHIVEPGLAEVVKAVVQKGSLRAVLQIEPADVFVVAVPTPFKERHKPDLHYIKEAADKIARVLKKGDLVILESTSPVGSTEQLAGWLSKLRPDLSFPQQRQEQADVQLAYCPERVLPGNILHELIANDRIIGGMTKRASELAKQFYQYFVEGACILTQVRMAEMVKLTENTFRDVNIAFANELSLICDRLDFNAWELIALANRHPRVNILQPGVGVGGHCIAVDPWFIVDSAPQQSKLIRTAREINDAKPHAVLEKLQQCVQQRKNKNKQDKPTVACLGLAFKPDIDDVRESPALHIVEWFARDYDGPINVVEPYIQQLPDSLIAAEHVSLTSLEEALAQAQVVIALVRHRMFFGVGQRLADDVDYLDMVNVG